MNEPRSTHDSDDLLKIACYCTGRLLEEYDRLTEEIRVLLQSICDEDLLEGASRTCFIVAGSNDVVMLPVYHNGFLKLGLHDDDKLLQFHMLTHYNETRREEAFQKLQEIRRLIKPAMVLYGEYLRLLLDRMAMRSLFKRPLDDGFNQLNESAHPSKILLESPDFSRALIWLSRWSGPNPAKPDPEFRRLGQDDESLLTYYARPLADDVRALHATGFVHVSGIALFTRSHAKCEYTYMQRSRAVKDSKLQNYGLAVCITVYVFKLS